MNGQRRRERKSWRGNEDNRSGTNSALLCVGGQIYDTKKREKEQISEMVEKRENDLTFTLSVQPMMHQYHFIDHRSSCFMVTYSHHIPARYQVRRIYL